MIRKIQLLFVLLLGSFAFAQNSTASPYSLGALGDVTFRGNAINRIMGGMDAYADSIHANINNPASLGELKLTTFSVGVNYRTTSLSTDIGKENVSSGAIDYLAVSIPTKHFAFSFGVLPYSSVGYLLQSVGTTAEDLTTLSRYEGSGGVNKTFLTAGFRPFKFLNVGASVQYNFGTINTQSSYEEEGIDFGTFLRNSSSLSGLNIQLSAHYKYQLSEDKRINLFTTFSPKHNLRSKNLQTFFTQTVGTRTPGDFQEIDLAARGLDELDLTLGSRIDIGLSVEHDKKWLVGIQYTASNSGNYQNDFIKLNNVSYENGSRLSIGGMYIPSYSSFTTYWKRMVFRAGFRHETSGILINNTSLKETGISFGVGLPIGGYYSGNNVAGFSNINIGLEVGKRGTTTAGLIKENFVAIRVGMSLNDLWFIKRVYN